MKQVIPKSVVKTFLISTLNVNNINYLTLDKLLYSFQYVIDQYKSVNQTTIIKIHSIKLIATFTAATFNAVKLR